MNFPQKSKPRSSHISNIVWIVSIFVLLSGTVFLFPKFTRTIATGIATPVWIVKDKTISIVQNIGGYFVSKQSLIKNNMSLQAQVVALTLKTNDYDTLTTENENLKTLLGRAQTATSNTRVLARILSKPPQSPYDTLVINAGSTNNVSIGDKVYISDTEIIGLVTDVTSHTSLVTLFSSSDQKTSAEDARTGTSFTLLGMGGANIQLTVPKETDILWGDTFVYPALSSEIIGSVYYIDTSSQSSFKTVYLRLPGNVFSMQWVFVEKGM